MKHTFVQILKILAFTGILSLIASCSPNVGLQKYNINQAITGMPLSIKNKVGDFKFYFGTNSAPIGAQKLGQVSASPRTNAWGKPALKSCNWVFYSALISLKKQAQERGGNAVANIQSNWKDNKFDSKTEFEGDNTFNMSGVALIGEVIKE
jgi:hypothetical protein